MHEKIALYITPYEGPTSYNDMIDIAIENGIKNIEPVASFEFRTPDTEYAKEFRRRMDDAGLNVPCFSIGVNLADEGRFDAIEKAKKYAEAAAIVGSPYLHHTIVYDCSNPDYAHENKDRLFNEGMESVRIISDYAKSLGIKTIFEDQGYIFNGVENMKKFFDVVDRDCGLVADFGNIAYADEKVEDLIKALPDKVEHVHVKDIQYFLKDDPNAKGSPTYNYNFANGCAFGDGNVNFDAAFSALKEIGYNGYFAIEGYFYVEDPKKSFKKNLEITNYYLEKYGF